MENEYKGLTVERVKREEVFKNFTDKQAQRVIDILEKYSIGIFPSLRKVSEKIAQYDHGK